MFELAAGSVVGTDHRQALKESNGHDAYGITSSESVFGSTQICLVADGCGSGAHSEVGAKIGVRLLQSALAFQLKRWQKTDDAPRMQFMKILERARQDVLAQMRTLALSMGGSYSSTINEHFLFTLVGAILTEEFCVFFSRGDGLIIINGEEFWIEPEAGNAPVYLAYALVDTSLADVKPESLKFEILQVVSTERLDHFLVGTDGLRHFVRASQLRLPGKDQLVGPLSQFWEEERFFRNTDNIRRRLALANLTSVLPDWDARRLVTEAGHLKDDTTLIVGRRQ